MSQTLAQELVLIRMLSGQIDEFRQRIADGRDCGALPGSLPELALDGVLSWLAGHSEAEWREQAWVDEAEIEYLKDAGVWPWGRNGRVDTSLRESADLNFVH